MDLQQVSRVIDVFETDLEDLDVMEKTVSDTLDANDSTMVDEVTSYNYYVFHSSYIQLTTGLFDKSRMRTIWRYANFYPISFLPQSRKVVRIYYFHLSHKCRCVR